MSLLRSGASLQEKVKTLNTLKDKLKNLDTPKSVKETIFERWGIYWKGLYQDYREVAVDVVAECRERPIKALFYLSALASGYYCCQNNPGELTFREDLLKSTMKLINVSESMRNPESVAHVSHMNECLNGNFLRRLNLGLFSLMWVDQASSKCANYKYTCNYLKPRYLKFHERIVDVGFLNKWWILERKMEDYDINDNEFS